MRQQSTLSSPLASIYGSRKAFAKAHHIGLAILCGKPHSSKSIHYDGGESSSICLQIQISGEQQQKKRNENEFLV